MGQLSTSYHLSQALTSHGVYRSYANRFNRDHRWEVIRQVTYTNLESTLTPDTQVSTMIESKFKWKSIHGMTINIMSRKEAEEMQCLF